MKVAEQTILPEIFCLENGDEKALNKYYNIIECSDNSTANGMFVLFSLHSKI